MQLNGSNPIIVENSTKICDKKCQVYGAKNPPAKLTKDTEGLLGPFRSLLQIYVFFYKLNLCESIYFVTNLSPVVALTNLMVRILPPNGLMGAPLSTCHPWEPSPYSSL